MLDADCTGNRTYFCNHPASKWHFDEYYQHTHGNMVDKSTKENKEMIFDHYIGDLGFVAELQGLPTAMKSYVMCLKSHYKASSSKGHRFWHVC